MREIKFRGKREDNGEWVIGKFLKLATPEEYFILPIGGDASPALFYDNYEETGKYIVEAVKVIPETVGQFTGLKDKNGVEIYEGDVVREQGNDYTPIYQNGVYMAYNVDKINDPYVSTQFNVIWRNGCKVIGNIHDHEGEAHDENA